MGGYGNEQKRIKGCEALESTGFFKNRKVNLERLQKFGFVKDDAEYHYAEKMVDNQFSITVTINKDGEVSTKVVDLDSQEEYVLHRISGASGSFVGMVRAEHDDLLQKIVEQCYEVEIFKNPQTKELIQYIQDSYGAKLEYLWKRFQNNAICRRTDNQKWFCLIMTVAGDKIGMDTPSPVEVIDLRAYPEDIERLLLDTRYLPGYHMSKKSWFTVVLDYSVPTEELTKKIEESFHIVGKK